MQSDEEIRDVIIKLSSKSESPVSYRLVIGDSGETRIPDVALMMLDEDEADVVNAALIVMRNFSWGRREEFLEKAMPLLDQPSYSENVMSLIRRYGDASYVEKVLKFLSYPMPEIRIAAINTIERFHYNKPFLIEIALAMLSDPDENMRNRLIYCVRRSKEPRVINRLLSLMYNDESYMVQKTAAYSLDYNGDPEGRRLAKAWLESNEGKA